MSYTGSRSYGAGRIYSVPHYNVNSQHIGRQRQNNASGVPSNTAPSSDDSSASGSKLRTPAVPGGTSSISVSNTGNTSFRTSSSATSAINSSSTAGTPGSINTPGSPSGTAPGSTPRSMPGTTPAAPRIAPGTIPGSPSGNRQTATPSETAPRSNIQDNNIPGTPPANLTAPQTPATPVPDSQAPGMRPDQQTPANQLRTSPTAPQTMPEGTPGTMPGGTAGSMPGNMSGSMPGTGSAIPRTAPGTAGTMPGSMQGTTPESRRESAPGTVPDGGPSEAVPRDTPGLHFPGTPPVNLTTPQRSTIPTIPGNQSPGMRPGQQTPANMRGTSPTAPNNMPGGTSGSTPNINQNPMPHAPTPRIAPSPSGSMQGNTGSSIPDTPGSVPNGMNSTINGMEQSYPEGFHYFINNHLPNHNPYKAPMGIPLYPLYGYDSCEELDKDAAYIKQLYPSKARAILPYVESECDQLEYDGSVMFDEYPDKVALDRIIDRIYEKVKDLDEEETQVEAKSIYFYPQRRYGSGLRDLVNLLLLNEIFNRRRRYRSRRRWF